MQIATVPRRCGAGGPGAEVGTIAAAYCVAQAGSAPGARRPRRRTTSCSTSFTRPREWRRPRPGGFLKSRGNAAGNLRRPGGGTTYPRWARRHPGTWERLIRQFGLWRTGGDGGRRNPERSAVAAVLERVPAESTEVPADSVRDRSRSFNRQCGPSIQRTTAPASESEVCARGAAGPDSHQTGSSILLIPPYGKGTAGPERGAAPRPGKDDGAPVDRLGGRVNYPNGRPVASSWWTSVPKRWCFEMEAGGIVGEGRSRRASDNPRRAACGGRGAAPGSGPSGERRSWAWSEVLDSWRLLSPALPGTYTSPSAKGSGRTLSVGHDSQARVAGPSGFFGSARKVRIRHRAAAPSRIICLRR
jgi:hypothetical protein